MQHAKRAQLEHAQRALAAAQQAAEALGPCPDGPSLAGEATEVRQPTTQHASESDSEEGPNSEAGGPTKRARRPAAQGSRRPRAPARSRAARGHDTARESDGASSDGDRQQGPAASARSRRRVVDSSESDSEGSCKGEGGAATAAGGGTEAGPATSHRARGSSHPTRSSEQQRGAVVHTADSDSDEDFEDPGPSRRLAASQPATNRPRAGADTASSKARRAAGRGGAVRRGQRRGGQLQHHQQQRSRQGAGSEGGQDLEDWGEPAVEAGLEELEEQGQRLEVGR